MAVANYNAIVALPGAYAIRFNASDAHQDYYEFNPAEGMLLNNFPAGMFSDTSIYWIERVRGTFDGQTGVNDGGQSYVKVAIGFHKDSSVVAQNTFLGAMSNDASWILINETTEEWLMWPANGSAGGELGSGFVTYQVIPSYIADTSGLGQRDVPAIAEDFDGIEPLIAGQVFQNGLINSELVVGLIPNNTFRPSFGPFTRPIAATFPGVSGTLSAAVARATPVTHPAAANFGGAAGSISAALQRQIATVNLAVAVTFSGTAGSISVAVAKAPQVNLAVAVTFPGTAGSISVAVAKAPQVNLAVAVTFSGAAGSISAGATRVPAPIVRGYVGRISQSPVAEALTEAGRLALDRAIPDADQALAVAYDWENAPIGALRSQAAAWGFAPFTTLLGETYERQIMATFGRVVEYRNKWLVLDDFFDALNIIYSAEIVGRDGVRYAVDRQAGNWGGYDVTRARELWLLVTLPPGIHISDAQFIAYLAHAVRWLMPYFRHFVFLVFVNQRINATPAAHPGVGTVAMSYLEAVQA